MTPPDVLPSAVLRSIRLPWPGAASPATEMPEPVLKLARFMTTTFSYEKSPISMPVPSDSLASFDSMRLPEEPDEGDALRVEADVVAADEAVVDGLERDADVADAAHDVADDPGRVALADVDARLALGDRVAPRAGSGGSRARR